MLFEGEVRISADKPTNSLVIVASAKDFLSLRSVIRKLDIPRRQVFVEAAIMEITMDKSRKLGFAYHGAGAVGEDRAARVLVANSAEFPVGLVVDEVYGFRRFLQREHVAEFPPTAIRCEACLQGAFRRGLEIWPVFSLSRLLENRDFQRTAEA